MSALQRRDFLRGLAIAGCTTEAKAAERVEDLPEAVPEAAQDVTRQLAHFVVSSHPSDLPEKVRKEASRTLLNWMGCAIGGSRQDAVTNAIAALAPFAGSGQASLVGRSERMDSLHAALINGISSHVLDFDDTHLKTVIHPAGPVVPAILAIAEHRPVSGRDFLTHWCSAPRWNAVSGMQSIPRITMSAGTLREPMGAGDRRLAAGWPAGDVRLDDQELPSRPCRAERADGGPAGLL